MRHAAAARFANYLATDSVQFDNAMMQPPAVLLPLVLIIVLMVVPCWSQTAVVTEHNDNARTGQTLNELLLAPSNVNMQHFGKLFTQPVDGTVVGQPLMVPNLLLPNGTIHNVVYVTTQHDSVYAFDADSNQGNNAAPLWQVSFINPAAGITSVPIADFGCTGIHFAEIGIMGTPVIDLGSNTMYVVAKTRENGSYFFRLHALDITSGAEKFGGPVVLSASVPNLNGVLNFNPAIHMQRPALLLNNGVVYIGIGGNGCDTYKYHGWLFAYDSHTLAKLGVFVTTPNGIKGGFWQSGGGPAADAVGNIYFETANGTFDANKGGVDYGDTILKLHLGTSGFTVVDSFTPFNQGFLSLNDLDLGSGGVVLLPDQAGLHTHELIAGGKGSTVYLIDLDNMGKYDGIQDNVVQNFPNAVPAEIESVPAYWNNNVYITGEGDYIKQFSLNSSLLSSGPVFQTPVIFGLGGPGSVSVSANGASNGILWAIRHGSPILYAFDASNVSTMLYSSAQAPNLRDKMANVPRFATPTIANGKVYMAGQSLMVYGLFSNLTALAGNNQTAADGTLLPIPLQIQATSIYSGAPVPGATITCKDGGVGGAFSSAVMTTDSSGLASTTYRLPAKLLTVTINCTSPTFVPVTFTETAVAGLPTHFSIVSGNLQTGPAATILASPLVVRVTDIHYQPVAGVVVNFTDNGAGGIFSATSLSTDSKGLTSVTYTTPSVPGTYIIKAIASGLPAVKFTVTVN